MKAALVASALLSLHAPAKINIPLGPYLTLTLLTSGLSYSGYLAAFHPSEPRFAARYPDEDVGLPMYERIDLPEPSRLGAILTLHILF